MQIGAYFDHATWRTLGPQLTPLRVTPALPAFAGGVMAAAPRRPPLVEPGTPTVDDPVAAWPGSVVPVPVSPVPVPVPEAPLAPAANRPEPEPFWLLLTVGTRVTTRSRAVMPTTNGE